jgi:hypothetical protein
MAGISRVHGQAVPGAFYGLAPLVLKVADSGSGFTAASGGGTSAITEGGYDKAVRAVESLGSIVWLGTQADATFTCIVDSATFNNGAGATTSGAYGALKDALYGAGFTIVNLTITTSSALNGAGTFTFA